MLSDETIKALQELKASLENFIENEALEDERKANLAFLDYVTNKINQLLREGTLVD